MADAETKTSAPDIPDGSRTCRQCNQRVAADDIEFLIGAGYQCVCWRCCASWSDAPPELRARRAAEIDLVNATAEIRDAPVPDPTPDPADPDAREWGYRA